MPKKAVLNSLYQKSIWQNFLLVIATIAEILLPEPEKDLIGLAHLPIMELTVKTIQRGMSKGMSSVAAGYAI